MTHRLRLLGAPAIAALLLLGACSSKGGNDATKSTTTTTAPGKTSETTTTTEATTTTTTAPVDAAAQARVDKVDLSVSDFPSGWTASPPQPDDPNNPLDKCDPTFSQDTELARHDTSDFTIGSLDNGDGTQFSVSTKVYASAAEAKATLDPLNDSGVLACMDQALKAAFGADAGATITGNLAQDDPSLSADQAEGASAVYKIKAADGSTATVVVGLLGLRTADMVSEVSIVSIGQNFDAATLSGPVNKLLAEQSA